MDAFHASERTFKMNLLCIFSFSEARTVSDNITISSKMKVQQENRQLKIIIFQCQN